MGHMFLIVVDAYSKWLEVKMMTSRTTPKTIGCLRELFASYRCPELLVSDNGSQFSSAEFSSFLSSNGGRHVTSPPYHPQSNGAAERCVQTFKGAMKSMKDEPGNIGTRLLRFRFQYRSTPHATTGTSPAQLFLGRTLRTRLSMLHPDLAERVRVKQEKQQSSGPSLSEHLKKEIESGLEITSLQIDGKEEKSQGSTEKSITTFGLEAEFGTVTQISFVPITFRSMPWNSQVLT